MANISGRPNRELTKDSPFEPKEHPLCKMNHPKVTLPIDKDWVDKHKPEIAKEIALHALGFDDKDACRYLETAYTLAKLYSVHGGYDDNIIIGKLC